MGERSKFQVRFWGVRGSIPTPGPATKRVGGNTSCLEVRAGDDLLILDAGTGVRELGEKMIEEGREDATFLFSHVHWDHIMGFPFFRPAARKDRELLIYGERKGGAGIDEVLDYQAGQSHAPLVAPGKGAKLRFEALSPADSFEVGGFRVQCARANHPDGCIAFRVERDGHSFVYATDTEHFAEGLDESLLKLAQGTDFLVYDSMYTADEYSGKVGGSKKGWGHSTWPDGIRIAEKAGVGTFVLFHHDPSHDDAFVGGLEAECRKEFASSIAAREGMVLDVAAGEVLGERRAAPKRSSRKPAKKPKK